MSSLREKANLEMTLEDHQRVGSSAPKILRDNPGKRMVDLLTDDEVAVFMQSAIDQLERSYSRSQSGVDADTELVELLRDNFVLPNVKFLTSINRLPAPLLIRSIAVEFST